MANCCQNVKGNKTNKTKMTAKNKQTSKQNKKQNGRRGWGLKKQLTEWSSDAVIIIDLRETERGLKRVLLRLYHKQILADFYRFTSGRFGAKSRGL